MIKFSVEKGPGLTLIGLALSQANIERLQKGQPIYFNAGVIGHPEIEITVFWGKTQDELDQILVVMAQFIGPRTIVIDQKKGFEN